ncbi:MAG: tRNA threonylcarbamoyladenosine dehydratase [Lachnospiraceae bacterium]|nr:tRNA threonylcarbamoyladenosine dehydratase [Lachnospiraceae bacterium]
MSSTVQTDHQEIDRDQIFVRTRAMFGDEAMERLYGASVAIFGIGGVGGHVMEALARAGVGRLDLYDNDVVSVSNINRQLVAKLDTVGQYKTDVMKARIAQIHPQADVNCYHCFYMPENADQYDLSQYDYIVDAIDTVTAKIELVIRAQAVGVPIISCMGAGNKLDPTQFRVADIYETSVCPLARTMRKELKARGIKKCKVVYSLEPSIKPQFAAGSAEAAGWQQNRESEGADKASGDGTPQKTPRPRAVPGSNSFVPATAGLILAGQVIRDLSGI